MQTYSPGQAQVIKINFDKKQNQMEIKKELQSEELVLPDTHGYTAGIIQKLRDAGVITIDQSILNEIETLSSKEEITSDDLSKFDSLLDKATFNPEQYKLIRFLGDMLADRSGNDWFTLKLLKKLKQSSIHYEITLSNHDLEFLRWYKLFKDNSKNTFDFGSNIYPNQRNSLEKLRKLYEANLITFKDIEAIVEEYYLPHLRLSSITFDEEKFCTETESKPQVIRYVHAPSGTEATIPLYQTFVKKRTPNLETATAIDLMDAHDEIEEAFQKELKSNFWKRKTLTDGMEENGIPSDNEYGVSLPDPTTHPIEYICWNRDRQQITGSENYEMNIIHGHTGSDDNEHYDFGQKWGLGKIKGYNLDDKNNFGKSSSPPVEYTVYTSPSYLPSFKKLYNVLQARSNCSETKTEIKIDEATLSAGRALYTSSKAFLNFCLKHNLREEYKVVKEAITAGTHAIEKNNDTTLKELNKSMNQVAQLQFSTKLPSKVKKYVTRIVGALCIIAGGLVVSAGIFGIPFTFGMSIGLSAGIGGGLIAIGMGMLGWDLYSQYKNPMYLFNRLKNQVNGALTNLQESVLPQKSLGG